MILPFIFQSTGLLEKHGLEFLETVAEHAELVKKIPGVNIFTYFKRRLACCLAKNIGFSINAKADKMISHADHSTNRNFDPRIIMEANPMEAN